MKKPPVPYHTLLKTVTLVSLPSLLVLASLVAFDHIDLQAFLIAYAVILIGSLLLTLPFLNNVAALIGYVQSLALDKRVEAPSLGFLSMVGELSDALGKLQRIWEVKKQQMERIITEREILVDTLPDILIMINDEGSIIRTNRAARAIFG